MSLRKQLLQLLRELDDTTPDTAVELAVKLWIECRTNLPTEVTPTKVAGLSNDICRSLLVFGELFNEETGKETETKNPKNEGGP